MPKWSKVTRDKSHLPTQDELRKRGFSVLDLAMVGDDCPDLFVASPTTSCLVELKESLDSLVTVAQILFIANWQGNVMLALSTDDIVGALQSEKFLTSNEKAKMLQIAYRQLAKSKAKRPEMSVSRLRKLMYES